MLLIIILTAFKSTSLCQQYTIYSDVINENFFHSFRDGLAFCALIHCYRPDLIDYDSLKQVN